MVIVDVVADQSTKMLFVKRDDMIKNLSAATSYPAFRDAVLPRRLDACAFGFETRRLQKRGDIGIEY
jgi:hypothetical protein